MRKHGILALSLIVFFALPGLYAQEPLQLASRVVRVTVYADRALVTRSAEASLPKGESTLVFTGLPAATDQASIQVSGTGAFSLRDVRVVSRQLSRDVSTELKALEDEKRQYEDKLAVINDRIREADAERLFLAEMVKRLTSNAGASETLPFDTAAWAKMLDFHRARNAAVNEALRVSRADAKAVQLELDRVNREIRGLGTGARLSVLEAELVVEASAATKARVELSYLVSGPSWRPDYVLRADSEGSKLSVHYRALVRQNTGEAWENAAIQLSTARPQAGGSLPTLYPWYVDLYKPVVQSKEVPGVRGSAPMSAADSMWGESAAEEAPEPMMQFAAAEASTGATAVLFAIAGATTVNADNKDRTVTVALLDLPVRYSWAAVPKLSAFAYFRAEVTNSSDFPFLPGPSHIYVDGSYIADGSMASVPSGGLFDTDLGVDEGVKVERKLLRKFDESTGLLTKKSKTTWEYEIRVKNDKKREITLLVSDQLPISLNDQIVVKAIAPAYSKDSDTLRKTDGETFEWSLKLGAGREQTLPLSFSVEYPRGTPISGLE
jgi:uncharacterized protein (TIGR02231 family)